MTNGMAIEKSFLHMIMENHISELLLVLGIAYIQVLVMHILFKPV